MGSISVGQSEYQSLIMIGSGKDRPKPIHEGIFMARVIAVVGVDM